MFAQLETSAIANWVALSLWAYPSLLSLHIIGLAIVVGIFTMRDLRLLGLGLGPPAEAYARLGRLAVMGFALNAVSGFLLFTSQATVFVGSTPFLTKLLLIAVAMTISLRVQSRLRVASTGEGAELPNPDQLKGLAIGSLACWLGAITAGRLIAYL